MLTIRLQRRGRKHDPSFRLVVTDSKRSAQSGKYLEMVGSYDPRSDRADLRAERITHWMQHGTQVSDTVHNLLISHKVIAGKKINVLPKKTVPQAEAPLASISEPTAPQSKSEPDATSESQEHADSTEVAPKEAPEESAPEMASPVSAEEVA